MVQELGFEVVVGGFDAHIRAETKEDVTACRSSMNSRRTGRRPSPGGFPDASIGLERTLHSRVDPPLRPDPGINTHRSELVEEPGAMIPPDPGTSSTGPEHGSANRAAYSIRTTLKYRTVPSALAHRYQSLPADTRACGSTISYRARAAWRER